jgi:hypothetical protein
MVAILAPVWALLGGNGSTYALWRDSKEIAGQVISAGNLDISNDNWSWAQEALIVAPTLAQGGVVPVAQAQQGTCLTPTGAGTACADTSLPLNQFVAMPGDKIRIEGVFETNLAGDNAAARLQVTWQTPQGTTLIQLGQGTYNLAAWVPDTNLPDGGTWQTLRGDPTTDSLDVGDEITIVTVTQAADAGAGKIGGPDAVTLPKGIHLPGTVKFKITLLVDVEQGGARPYPYEWIDPDTYNNQGFGTGKYQFPDLTITLDQIRVGEGFGVNAP